MNINKIAMNKNVNEYQFKKSPNLNKIQSFQIPKKVSKLLNNGLDSSKTNYNYLEKYFSKDTNIEKKNNQNIINCKLDLLKQIYLQQNMDTETIYDCQLDFLVKNNLLNSSENNCNLDLLKSNRRESFKNDLTNQSMYSSCDESIKNPKTSLSTLEDSGKKKAKFYNRNNNLENLNKEKMKFQSLFNIEKITDISELKEKSFTHLNNKDKLKINKNHQKADFNSMKGKCVYTNEINSMFLNCLSNFDLSQKSNDFNFGDWENIKDQNMSLREELELTKNKLKNLKNPKFNNLSQNTNGLNFQESLRKSKKLKDLIAKKEGLIEEVNKLKALKYSNKLKNDLKNHNIESYYFEMRKDYIKLIDKLKLENKNSLNLISGFESRNSALRNYFSFVLKKEQENKYYEEKIKEIKSFLVQDYYEVLYQTKIKAKRLKEELDGMKKQTLKFKKKLV